MANTEHPSILNGSLDILLERDPKDGLERIKELLERHNFNDEEMRELLGRASKYIDCDLELRNRILEIYANKADKVQVCANHLQNFGNYGLIVGKFGTESAGSIDVPEDYINKCGKNKISHGACKRCCDIEMKGELK